MLMYAPAWALRCSFSATCPAGNSGENTWGRGSAAGQALPVRMSKMGPVVAILRVNRSLRGKGEMYLQDATRVSLISCVCASPALNDCEIDFRTQLTKNRSNWWMLDTSAYSSYSIFVSSDTTGKLSRKASKPRLLRFSAPGKHRVRAFCAEIGLDCIIKVPELTWIFVVVRRFVGSSDLCDFQNIRVPDENPGRPLTETSRLAEQRTLPTWTRRAALAYRRSI